MTRSTIVAVLITAFLVSQPGLAADPSLSALTREGTAREYYGSNRDRRFLIRVHVWGDTPLSGILYVPDDASLLDVVGLAGGPTGSFESAVVTLTRAEPAKGVSRELKVNGRELITDGKYRETKLGNGDVVYLESGKSDAFLRTLTIASTVLTLISTAATLYLITKK